MDATDVTHPTSIWATCTDCEELKTHSASDADADGLTVVYECMDCESEVELDLDP